MEETIGDKEVLWAVIDDSEVLIRIYVETNMGCQEGVVTPLPGFKLVDVDAQNVFRKQ
ncbi:hypothetical protein H0G86_006504 [Trichoderma simmonsii]|uniref:Uncharacterized protein n=1 Tax=Trichoderma simmonsii TaxID=1491479 RepID=A0A8G0LBM7_9HYPO|nr:hypothetical protein H0G86_006504 [Trichoderma simmonsii]